MTRPCSRAIASGPAASARASISRTFGSCSAIAARSASLSASTWSSSASSISVASNRSPWLSGAICGWSGRTIVAPSTVSSLSVASTGKMFTWSHARTAAAAVGPGATGEAKRPPGACATRCVESSDDRSAAARSSPSGTSVVLWTHIDTRTSPSSSGVVARRTRPCTESKANSTVESACTSTRRATPWWRSPLGSRKASVPETGDLGAGLQHDLHPRAIERVRPAGRVHRRIDDAERRRRRVLGRPGRVRVERVALVEQRGEQPLDAHSSSRTVSSNECSPRSALRCDSASSVSRWRRIQPPPG